MTFAHESEMYDILERWLRDKDSFSCNHVIQEFKYNSLGRRWRGDVVGRYMDDDTPCFIGIEAKLGLSSGPTAFRQAEALKSFCSQVFVAFPYSKYYANEDKASQIQNYLRLHNIGIILVQKGKTTIIEEPPVGRFELLVYRRACEDFEKSSPSIQEGAYAFLEDCVCEWEDNHKHRLESAFADYCRSNEQYAGMEFAWTSSWIDGRWLVPVLAILDEENDESETLIVFGDIITVEKRFTSKYSAPVLRRHHKELAERGAILAKAFEESQYKWENRGLDIYPTLEIRTSYGSLVRLASGQLEHEDVYLKMLSYLEQIEWNVSRNEMEFIVYVGFEKEPWAERFVKDQNDAIDAIFRALNALGQYLDKTIFNHQ